MNINTHMDAMDAAEARIAARIAAARCRASRPQGVLAAGPLCSIPEVIDAVLAGMVGEAVSQLAGFDTPGCPAALDEDGCVAGGALVAERIGFSEDAP